MLSDSPRWLLAKGGEGSGKSVAGIVKSLYKLSRGLSPGLMGSPDFEHFKRSLWPEFRRWCPWDFVVPSQRGRASKAWRPSGPFDMVFDTPRGQVVLMCGGFDNPSSWHGPNLQFAHFDEARRHNDAEMVKVLDGRIRVPGPNGEPPQGYLTTTPKKHWLYDYFGPWPADKAHLDDPLKAFKSRARVIDLITRDNEANLEPGYADLRRGSLTEAEARVFLEAAWEDEDEASPFLPSMTFWDACKEAKPTVDLKRWPMVIALDAGITNDLFAMVGVTRHPDRKRPDDTFVWITRTWRSPRPGVEVDFADVMAELRMLVEAYNIAEVTFDPYQMTMFAQALKGEGRVMVQPFSQQGARAEADKALRDRIIQRRIAHLGQDDLRDHIRNADQKRDAQDSKLRIVKRTDSQKIDLAVALSMAAARCAQLPL